MGELYAVLAAMVWAFAVILFKRAGETVSPFALNLFRVVVSCGLLLIVMAVGRVELWRQAPLQDYLILLASGIIAIAISDTLFHMCLNRVGAGINAIVDCLYSPFVVLFAWLLVGERLNSWQIGGMGCVIVGVLIATRVQPPRNTSRRTLLVGIGCGVLAMATIAFGIVIAKPVLDRSSVLWATTVRQIGCVAVMVPVALISPSRRRIFSVFAPRPELKFTLTGTVLGSFLALLLWIAGMKYTTASAAGILNQTSTIYILVFASLFLKEPFSRRKGLAAGVALLGILLVVMN